MFNNIFNIFNPLFKLDPSLNISILVIIYKSNIPIFFLYK